MLKWQLSNQFSSNEPCFSQDGNKEECSVDDKEKDAIVLVQLEPKQGRDR